MMIFSEGRIPVIHPHNVIHVTQDMDKFWSEVIMENNDVQLGGWYRPLECEPTQHVAIIIPYRNRNKHLAVLLRYLHPVLKRQLLFYQIFVVEQVIVQYFCIWQSSDTFCLTLLQFGYEAFNKARLMNIAFDKIKTEYNNTFDCFIFHDVDLLLENDKNIYACGQNPVHLSPSVDSLHYMYIL